MNSHIEKVTVYSGRGKNQMMNSEGGKPLLETDLSSNNDKRWSEGTPSEKALRRVIVRSEIRNEQKPEPSHRYRRCSKQNRRAKVIESRNSSSTSDRTWDERNKDTMEALKQQVHELKKKLKKKKTPGDHSTPAGQKLELGPKDPYHLIVQVHRSKRPRKKKVTNGRNKGGRSSYKGSRGNWSESTSMARQPYRERREQETVWKALHQISHSPFSKEIESTSAMKVFTPELRDVRQQDQPYRTYQPF